MIATGPLRRHESQVRGPGSKCVLETKRSSCNDAECKGHHVQGAGRGECLVSGTRALAVKVKDASGVVVHT